MLVELIYASEAGPDTGLSDVQGILEVSRRNNARDAVTGALVFNSRHFLQWLEGERGAVSRVYHRIAADPRHRAPVLLGYREIAQRTFGDWGMGYMGEGLMNRELLLRFSETERFDPFAMSADSARALMLALREVSVPLRA